MIVKMILYIYFKCLYNTTKYAKCGLNTFWRDTALCPGCETLTQLMTYKRHTHPFCGSLFHTEDFDSFGQMELMVFKVGAEKCALCARVSEGYANITDDWGLVLFYTQLSRALLEHNLDWDKWNKREQFKECELSIPCVIFHVFKKCSVSSIRILTGWLLPTRTRSWSLRPPTVLVCSGWTMPMSAFCLKRSRPVSWNSILSQPFGPMRITVHITSVIWRKVYTDFERPWFTMNETTHCDHSLTSILWIDSTHNKVY